MKTFLLGFLLTCWCAFDAFAQGPQNVLIIVNENSPDSQAIARYYAGKRNISNICAVRTTEREAVSRSAFEREILQPVSSFLKSKSLQDQILYIVTTRGLPLVVEGTRGPMGDLATVDSELALLYDYMVRGSLISQGRVENPYFVPAFRDDDFRPFNRRSYDIYLVTRLSGSNLSDSTALVDRAIATGSAGSFTFDLSTSRESTEFEWVQEAAAVLKQAGQNVTVDNTSKKLDNLTGVGGYVNDGSPVPTVQWSSGSIADILGVGTATTASGFIRSGVSGFVGYVSDPTADGYVRPQVLFPAYTAGYNLAEACYAAARYVGWRQVVLGDPLASPYGNKSAGRRESLAESFRTPVDSATGLPEYFARRRQAYLTRRYDTGSEAVALLLNAESAAARGDYAAATASVDKSLEQDPRLADSNLLKAGLLEHAGDFKAAFDRYRKALESGATSPWVYEKLAGLALEKLGDPAKAEPYAAWLYRQFGGSDPRIAALYAEVKGRTRKTERAASNVLSQNRQQNPPPSVPAAPMVNPDAERAATSPARVINPAPIPYPKRAKERGIQGVVEVDLLIDEMGQLMKIDEVRGDRLLAEEVLKAVKSWRFVPKMENGRALACRITLPFVFDPNKPFAEQ